MKYLIVNGDDFGASRGINRGILEAHRRGILTSTSLMVNAPCSEEAAALSHDMPDLSVGLHVHIEGSELSDAVCRAQLHDQFLRFQHLIGRPPTHLDSHHNIHRDPRLLPHFLAMARQYDLPLREHSSILYFSKFYGQWGGETHLEQIGVENLVHMLKSELHEGITELSCHPGYVDPDLQSGYSAERETELRTLCDPSVRSVLKEQQIELAGFRDASTLLAGLQI